MTLLSLVEQVCDEIGFDKPTTIIDSADRTAIQMLALANASGKQIAKRGKGMGGWAVLQTEHTFTTTASTAEYALPSDYDFLIDDTLWDRENFWKLRGPLSPQQWQQYKSGIVSTGPRRRLRIKPSASSNVKAIFIDPTPDTSAETLVFEYVSLNWCESSGGTAAAAWAVDTDTGILDEYLLQLDLKWRFLRAKGRSYSDEKHEFEMELSQALARDGGQAILSMAGTDDRLFMDARNLPDSGFG